MAVTWATQQSITQLTAVNTTEQRSTNLNLTASYLTNLEVVGNNSSTAPTDALIIKVYRSQDNTTFDNEPYMQFSWLPSTTGDDFISFDMPMCRHIEIGATSAGATDTYVVDVNYQRVTGI